jgi:hypothetical protein
MAQHDNQLGDLPLSVVVDEEHPPRPPLPSHDRSALGANGKA